MAAEYLSPQEAGTVELPVFNPLARIAAIRRYAGALCAGEPPLDCRPITRTGLVALAERRHMLDAARETQEVASRAAAMSEQLERDFGPDPNQLNFGFVD